MWSNTTSRCELAKRPSKKSPPRCLLQGSIRFRGGCRHLIEFSTAKVGMIIAKFKVLWILGFLLFHQFSDNGRLSRPRIPMEHTNFDIVVIPNAIVRILQDLQFCASSKEGQVQILQSGQFRKVTRALLHRSCYRCCSRSMREESPS